MTTRGDLDTVQGAPRGPIFHVWGRPGHGPGRPQRTHISCLGAHPKDLKPGGGPTEGNQGSWGYCMIPGTFDLGFGNIEMHYGMSVEVNDLCLGLE